MRKLYMLITIVMSAGYLTGQNTFPVNGVHNEIIDQVAFTNATIYVAFNNKLENATLLIRDSKVVAVGQDVKIPEATIVYDLNGKYVYPSFIDLYSSYGMPKESPKESTSSNTPQYESSKEGAYGWNEAIRSDVRAVELFRMESKEAAELRKVGFGAVLTHQKDGIARGSGALVSLGEKNENETVLDPLPSAHYSFKKGSSRQQYPNSLMGAIALLRQTYADANWYKSLSSGDREEFNLTLEKWTELQNLVQIFEVDNKLSLLRADKLGDENGHQYIIKGIGDEYQRIDEVRKTAAKLILPLNFPEAFDVSDPYDANLVSLKQMKHWEMAPANAAMLQLAGIEFALTAADLEKPEEFIQNLRKAVKHGLSPEAALKALSLNPASFIGASDMLGTLEKGKLANFIICSGDLFEDKSTILENWVQGELYRVNNLPEAGINGKYILKHGKKEYAITFTGAPEKLTAKVSRDTLEFDTKFKWKNDQVSLQFEDEEFFRLSGYIKDNKLEGSGQDASGNWFNWKAEKGVQKDSIETKDSEEIAAKGEIIYPFTAYGWETPPVAGDFLIRNATVWTNEDDGVIEGQDVLVRNGKISKIGLDLPASGLTVIDGTGKHLTCGIIDEHSHIAIEKGVNEGSNTISAEVRIGDVIDSEDIDIYRQLAGGVTTSQLLHGSANPIGGQSAIIKLRWGLVPEQMKFDAAAPFIKFALGENVKQSNWGSEYSIRYPQTRMGVEQVYVDAFTRAKEYMAQKESALKNKKAFRIDYQQETLAEILRSERFITCHSYVQSEINMLMKVAESFDFRINTFTHILEGYKLADKMKEHGVGGSTFSDWWAYKYEVIDAIPYNAALLTKSGVVTAINSDDAEMGRRLNQEAAKAIKYGGLSEEEAWKLVTLNPAKLLRIDARVGSIKPGKDADLVLWSENPLSIYAKAEKTWVDGICYFDSEKDIQLQNNVKEERMRLINAMLKGAGDSNKLRIPGEENKPHFHCDTVFDFCASGDLN